LIRTEAEGRERFEARATVRRVLSEFDPQDGELEALRAQRGALEERAARQKTLAKLIHVLAEGDGALLDSLYDAANELDGQQVLPDSSAELEEAAALVEGVAAAVRREHDAVERGDELAAVRQRLADFRSAAERLGTSPDRLASLWSEAQADLAPAELAARLSAAERALELEEEALAPLVTRLSRARVRAGQRLAKAVTAQLPGLGLGDARFQIRLEQDGVGRDSVAFSFAAHRGADASGLEQASGGELARLFLAIGLEVAGRADERLLVFDEVDQNVGARLGRAVGICLRGIAKGRQVLTITHLAPVAAQAHRHLKVAKTGAGGSRRGVARATVMALDGEARVEELALMIRGAPLTQAALEQARELLEEATGKPGIRRRRSARIA
jgi:DNA repair protein RecN (Recombination protein N)